MKEEDIVRNIRKLSSYIYDTYIQNEEQKFGFLLSNSNTFVNQLEVIYDKWFPKAKAIKDADIISRIFRYDIDEKDAKIWVKYSLFCLIEVSKMIIDNVKHYKTEDDLEMINELELLREISFEAAIFLETSFNIMEDRKVEFGHGKRFYIDSFETFSASQQILRKQTARNSIGTFALVPSSIFLIRQSIELWLQKLFGIKYIVDVNNNLIKLQPERLFSLIDKNVTLPVSKTVIQKIHKWTQVYVHGGIMPYTWEIVHAQKTISGIFYLHEIEVKKVYYNSVEEKIKRLLKDDNIKLIRCKTEVKVIS